MNILEISIGLAAGFLAGYLTSYFNEKGKNKALLGDIQKLTQEKESVIAKFQLDLAKRKYQYETKKEQYFKYFNLLDQFSADGNKETQEKFFPVINKFNSDFLAAQGNQKKEFLATKVFSEAVNNIVLGSNDKLIKIKNETSSLRLIAGEATLALLDDLEYYYNISFEKSGQMMNQMAKLVSERKVDQLKQQQLEIEAIGTLTNETKEKLIKQVRQELDEI